MWYEIKCALADSICSLIGVGIIGFGLMISHITLFGAMVLYIIGMFIAVWSIMMILEGI